MRFEHRQLSNGLEIVGEINPDARSTAVGFFVRTGARDEPPPLAGVSHFLEHMVFKGSARRSGFDVNREFDEIGARYNAFTSEENTVFWGAVLPEYLPRLIDLLSDVLRPSLRAEDFEMEKKVILEEIGMYQDQPMWSAYERIMRDHFGASPLGNSVLGTKKSIGAISVEQARAYFNRRYVAGNIVVAVTGKVDWPRFCDLIAQHCEAWPGGTGPRQSVRASGNGAFRVMKDAKINQEHVLLLASAPAADSEDRFAADVLALALGDGTGSRLFWELVDPGLAETAELEYHEYSDAGTFMTYVSCDPKRARRNLDLVLRLYRQVLAENIRDDELEQVKNKAAARIVLRGERPMGRLTPLGFNWVYRREYRSVDDELRVLGSISRDDVRRVLDQFPLDRVTTVAIGRLPQSRLRRTPVRSRRPAAQRAVRRRTVSRNGRLRRRPARPIARLSRKSTRITHRKRRKQKR